MKLGINSDPKHNPMIRTIQDSNAEMVRFPARKSRNYNNFIKKLQVRGIEPLIIVTGEWLDKSANYVKGLQHLRDYYPTVNNFQLGNEVDNPKGAGLGSEPREPEDYQELLYAGAEVMPDKTKWGAGAADGSPDYFVKVRDMSMLQYFAVHMATQTPDTAGDRLDLYEQFGITLVVTEFYALHGGFDSEEERANYVSNMIVAMSRCAWGFFYALYDKQFSEGGLVGPHQSLYESFAAFANA